MNILAITGNRADYDLLYPVLRLLEEDPAYRLTLLATGAHLSFEFGASIELIRDDGFSRVVEVPSLQSWDTPVARLNGIGHQMLNLSREFELTAPDAVLVLGDREEPLTAAITANYMNIPVLHIFGGDSGWSTPDDRVRHAVSMLADYHFPVTTRSAQNLQNLGIDPVRIHQIGNPGLDRIRLTRALTTAALSDRLKIDLNDMEFILVTFHPLDYQRNEAGDQMDALLAAAQEFPGRVLINTPNSDAGNHHVRRVIEHYANTHSHLHALNNLPREIWVNLLRRARLLLGNSSAGILEAPWLELPVVNVGDRQRGREHTRNVVFCDNDRNSIHTALQQALELSLKDGWLKDEREHFGDGHAAEKLLAYLNLHRDSLTRKGVIHVAT